MAFDWGAAFSSGGQSLRDLGSEISARAMRREESDERTRQFNVGRMDRIRGENLQKLESAKDRNLQESMQLERIEAAAKAAQRERMAATIRQGMQNEFTSAQADLDRASRSNDQAAAEAARERLVRLQNKLELETGLALQAEEDKRTNTARERVPSWQEFKEAAGADRMGMPFEEEELEGLRTLYDQMYEPPAGAAGDVGAEIAAEADGGGGFWNPEFVEGVGGVLDKVRHPADVLLDRETPPVPPSQGQIDLGASGAAAGGGGTAPYAPSDSAAVPTPERPISQMETGLSALGSGISALADQDRMAGPGAVNPDFGYGSTPPAAPQRVSPNMGLQIPSRNTMAGPGASTPFGHGSTGLGVGIAKEALGAPFSGLPSNQPGGREFDRPAPATGGYRRMLEDEWWRPKKTPLIR